MSPAAKLPANKDSFYLFLGEKGEEETQIQSGKTSEAYDGQKSGKHDRR
jgi:hypothetical protein